ASSRVARTCTALRGLLRKLYHSSVRSHSVGRPLVDGWSGFAIWTVARWIWGWLANQAPTSRPYHGHPYSVSLAEWMPTKPPPERTYRSKAAFSPASRTSPVVLRKTTTLYRASAGSLNRAASSVQSTAKPC